MLCMKTPAGAPVVLEEHLTAVSTSSSGILTSAPVNMRTGGLLVAEVVPVDPI